MSCSPVERSHHSYIKITRFIPSDDWNILTIFLKDETRKAEFDNKWNSFWGFFAVAERYQNYGYDFYLANYWHFVFLLTNERIHQK